MRRFFTIILISIALLSGCRNEPGSSKPSGFDLLTGDDTEQVSQLILEANAELKQVKAIYKANQKKADELKLAMTGKDLATTKTIADDLVIQINEGMSLAESAYKKIEDAEKMNINGTYKEYLQLKRDSLRRQIDAFELRRLLAKTLSEKYGVKDPTEVKKLQDLFRDSQIKFQELIDEGRDLSQQANAIWEESTQK